MNRYLFLVLATALSVPVKGYCADISFDNGINVTAIMQEIQAGKPNGPQPGKPPKPGQGGPDNHGNNNNSGNHGNNNNSGNGHGNDNNFGNDNGGPDNHHNHNYVPVYPDMDCRFWEFTSQTPDTRTEKITAEEPSHDCYTRNGTTYCRSTGRYYSRKITVNIGSRKLEAWEKESLKVCLEGPGSASLAMEGMLYEYSVSEQNHDSFFGSPSTVFSLTPGAKKPAKPDAKELSVQTVAKGEGGALFMAIADARADYFKGEQIDIRVDGMNVPDLTGLSAGEIISAFVNIKVSGSYPVAPLYNIKLTDTPKPGTYVVTITVTRRGQLSSPEPVSMMETFIVK